MLSASKTCGRVSTASGPARPVPCVSRITRPCVPASLGKTMADGWIDLASLVANSSGSKSPWDELATQIGKEVYVDVAGWHLYLRDMTAAPGLKMHTALAQQLGPQSTKRVSEAEVGAVLKKVPVKLGAGKTQLSLYDVVPAMCLGDLTRILEDYGRR
ncbi:hypothetical protein QJQ45_005576 [Haematococcus lacustris]|nr:hypothetical protein QJQ45_005576 [Haematococcus lacustris]